MDKDKKKKQISFTQKVKKKQSNNSIPSKHEFLNHQRPNTNMDHIYNNISNKETYSLNSNINNINYNSNPSQKSYNEFLLESNVVAFSSEFDSGNIKSVNQHLTDKSKFIMEISHDCEELKIPNRNKSWYFFSVIFNHKFNRYFSFIINNIANQSKYYAEGYKMLYFLVTNKEDHDLVPVGFQNEKDLYWKRLESDILVNTFTHDINNPKMSTLTEIEWGYKVTNEAYSVYFAFCYPYSLSRVYNFCEKINQKINNEKGNFVDININYFNNTNSTSNTSNTIYTNNIKGVTDIVKSNSSNTLSLPQLNNPISTKNNNSKFSSDYSYPNSQYYSGAKPNKSNIYFHKEFLTYSKQNRKMELITLSSYDGITNMKEQTLKGLFCNNNSITNIYSGKLKQPIVNRCYSFVVDKPIIFISARVHPAETMASWLLEGIINFLTDTEDLRAIVLRKYFVFKIIPILNPDGVSNGYYRFDSNGYNLNRHYINPDPAITPEIYAVKRLFLFYSQQYRVKHFFDLHGHFSTKGHFLFMNSMDYLSQIESLSLAFLLGTYNKGFSLKSCAYSEKSMKSKEYGDKNSKEGSSRVFYYKATGVVNAYTVEVSAFKKNKLLEYNLQKLEQLKSQMNVNQDKRISSFNINSKENNSQMPFNAMTSKNLSNPNIMLESCFYNNTNYYDIKTNQNEEDINSLINSSSTEASYKLNIPICKLLKLDQYMGLDKIEAYDKHYSLTGNFMHQKIINEDIKNFFTGYCYYKLGIDIMASILDYEEINPFIKQTKNFVGEYSEYYFNNSNSNNYSINYMMTNINNDNYFLNIENKDSTDSKLNYINYLANNIDMLKIRNMISSKLLKEDDKYKCNVLNKAFSKNIEEVRKKNSVLDKLLGKNKKTGNNTASLINNTNNKKKSGNQIGSEYNNYNLNNNYNTNIMNKEETPYNSINNNIYITKRNSYLNSFSSTGNGKKENLNSMINQMENQHKYSQLKNQSAKNISNKEANSNSNNNYSNNKYNINYTAATTKGKEVNSPVINKSNRYYKGSAKIVNKNSSDYSSNRNSLQNTLKDTNSSRNNQTDSMIVNSQKINISSFNNKGIQSNLKSKRPKNENLSSNEMSNKSRKVNIVEFDIKTNRETNRETKDIDFTTNIDYIKTKNNNNYVDLNDLVDLKYSSNKIITEDVYFKSNKVNSANPLKRKNDKLNRYEDIETFDYSDINYNEDMKDDDYIRTDMNGSNKMKSITRNYKEDNCSTNFDFIKDAKEKGFKSFKKKKSKKKLNNGNNSVNEETKFNTIDKLPKIG